MIGVRFCPDFYNEGFMVERGQVPIKISIGNIRTKMYDAKNHPNKVALYVGLKSSLLMGAALSVPIAFAARYGSWQKLEVKDLVKPFAVAMGTLSVISALGGVIGYIIGPGPSPYVPPYVNMDEYLDNWRHKIAVNYAHIAGYLGGGLLGAGVVGYAVLKRHQLSLGN